MNFEVRSDGTTEYTIQNTEFRRQEPAFGGKSEARISKSERNPAFSEFSVVSFDCAQSLP